MSKGYFFILLIRTDFTLYKFHPVISTEAGKEKRYATATILPLVMRLSMAVVNRAILFVGRPDTSLYRSVRQYQAGTINHS